MKIKVAHLDFSEAHHPNFERLVLYCLSSVGQAASHIYWKTEWHLSKSRFDWHRCYHSNETMTSRFLYISNFLAILLFVFRALKMIQCAWNLQGYMLDLRSQDLKENSSTSFWTKAFRKNRLLICVKWAYLRHYFWLHHLKSSRANRIKPSGKVAVCYSYDIWWKHCFSLSG